jgi:hypothetical protein
MYQFVIASLSFRLHMFEVDIVKNILKKGALAEKINNMKATI